MDISPVKTTFGALDDNSWLGSSHGIDSTRGITLDVSTFTAGTHYPDGYLLPGLPLGKITASGQYGLYDDAAVDGTEVCVGFLYGTTRVPAGATAVAGALLWHGVVVAAKLPITLDANGKADVAAHVLVV